MTSIPMPEEGTLTTKPVVDETNYLKSAYGIKSWLLTQDHKRIAIMYMIGIGIAFLLGGLFALAVRLELWTPTKTIVEAATYNKLFTLHGAIMTFLVLVPSIPAILGNFVLPMMLGAKDVAFPKLNLLSFYLWLLGAIGFVVVLFAGDLDTGWTFYAPYSIRTQTAVALAATGAFILGFSSILTGLNFMVTIHKMRAKTMGWFRMPLLLWGLYATSVIQIVATPVIGITVGMLFLEKLFHIGFFDPKLGGDPVLFEHFFWFYSHPVVYVMILPAMGVISEIITAMSRKHIFGYTFIAFSSIAIALFGFLVWGHHMFVSGQSSLMSTIFSLLTFSVSIPSAIKVFNWLATMYKGSISLAPPMLFAMGFLFLFGIGGLTGLFLGTLNTDVHLHDTYFIVAHFHYTMMGSALIGLIGGLFFYWPKIFGRMYSHLLGTISFILIFVGFNLTFIPQFLMGSMGMPRRYYNYPPEFQAYHQWSTVGSFVLAAGLFTALWCFIHSLFRGEKAPDNPWGAVTLDWKTSSPPHHHNFDIVPPVTDPYDMDDVYWDEESKGYISRSQQAALQELAAGVSGTQEKNS